MTVATGNFPELLWPGIKTKWGDSYRDYTPVYQQVFNVKTSDKAFEKDQGVTRLGLAAVKDQGDSITFRDPVQGFQREYVHVVYGLGTSITLEMYEDDQYNYINGSPRWLARAIRQTEETVHADVLNNAFGSELAADGLSIYNTAHVNVGTGTTQSNRPSTDADLTQTSLEQAYIDIADWTDDQDIRINVTPSRLVVPNELMWVAAKILGTQGEVNSADNTINPMYNIMPYTVWNYLTDPDAWFILTDQNEAGYTSYVRRRTTLDRDNEFDTQNLRYHSTRRWSQGLTDYRHTYASPGA